MQKKEVFPVVVDGGLQRIAALRLPAAFSSELRSFRRVTAQILCAYFISKFVMKIKY
jgi:hypothetical protein